jgi:hypothetical protein
VDAPVNRTVLTQAPPSCTAGFRLCPGARVDRWLAPSLFLVATWAWVMWAGMDVSWDVINHHFYLPFSLLSGRFATDLFAAGPQAYQNPLPYLPFYALASGDAPAWLVGTGLAIGHGLVGWPLWLLISGVWPEPGQRRWRWIALGLAWLSPVSLLLAGTSSVDPWSLLLVLGAVASLLGRGRNAALWSAVLMALAISVKLTNVVFALPLLLIAALRLREGQLRWPDTMRGCALGVLLLALLVGPWAWWLWHTFANPFFPLFNHWFESPYTSPEAVVAVRYTVTGPLDLVTRPFAMAMYRSYNGTEAFAPDLRPAALMLLVVPLLVAGWRRRATLTASLGRPVAQIGLFVVISYLGWIATSGNTRYGLPVLALIGVLATWAAQVALPERVAKVVLGVLIALQALYYGVDGERRYTPAPYLTSAPMLEVEVPALLRDQPFLHLSVGSLSFAAVAPHLNRDGALINAMGQWSLPMVGPLGDAFKERLQRWAGRTRILVRAQPDWDTMSKAGEFRARIDRVVYRLDFQVNWSDCAALKVHAGGNRAMVDDEVKTGLHATLISCGLVPRTTVDPNYEPDRIKADRVLALLESRCPRLLSPRPMVTDADLTSWQRRYPNSDSRITVSMTDGVVLSYYRSYQVAYLGSVDEILAGGGADPCSAWQRLTDK